MNKREAAEILASGEDCLGDDRFDCPDCPLYNKPCSNKIREAKKWLKDNPEKCVNKCEWKDGKFVACDNFNPDILLKGLAPWCMSCGQNIRKPEPSVIIKKSGGTWVARYDGVDYLDISGMSDKEDIELCDFTNLKDDSWWKPILEITITDEIAKLRPAIIVAEDSDLCTLYGVSNNIAVLLTGTIDIKHIRLATVTDLTNQE